MGFASWSVAFEDRAGGLELGQKNWIVYEVYEAFEDHEVGKVILISSINSETSPSCRFVDQKYMIAIVGLKSKPMIWILIFGTRVEFIFEIFLLKIMFETKARDLYFH